MSISLASRQEGHLNSLKNPARTTSKSVPGEIPSDPALPYDRPNRAKDTGKT